MKLCFSWKCQNKDETSREKQLVEIRRKSQNPIEIF